MSIPMETRRAWIAEDKAAREEQLRQVAPLKNAIDAAYRVTRCSLVDGRGVLLDLCNAGGGVLYSRHVDAPLQNLIGLAVRQAVRRAGVDPESVEIFNDLFEEEDDAWPLFHALNLLDVTFPAPDWDETPEVGGRVSFLRLRVTSFLCGVPLTADTQQLLVDAILATVADLEGVAA